MLAILFLYLVGRTNTVCAIRDRTLTLLYKVNRTDEKYRKGQAANLQRPVQQRAEDDGLNKVSHKLIPSEIQIEKSVNVRSFAFVQYHYFKAIGEFNGLL